MRFDRPRRVLGCVTLEHVLDGVLAAGAREQPVRFVDYRAHVHRAVVRRGLAGPEALAHAMRAIGACALATERADLDLLEVRRRKKLRALAPAHRRKHDLAKQWTRAGHAARAAHRTAVEIADP